jgi:hypothetical protein
MSDPGSPLVTRLLPDAVHQGVPRPGSAVVRLETTRDRRSVLDGAWWPRSRDITGELPSLVSALSGHLGPITRVGLDRDAWDELPTRMTIDGRVVHIDSFPVGDGTVLVTRGGNDLFSLLVVPPHTLPDAARAAGTAGEGVTTVGILVTLIVLPAVIAAARSSSVG